MGLFQWIGAKARNYQENRVLLKAPNHVAIIMDGNGRWAKFRGLPRSAGHRAGMERIQDTVETCLEVGVKHLTLFAFSTENWRRPTDEVNFLMKLFAEALTKEIAKLHQHGIQVRFIGSRDRLNPSLVRLMEQSEQLTENNQALVLNIAINYGGRAELVAATKGIVGRVLKGELDPDQITEAELSKHLFTRDQPDPDLLIKPGGEFRISNFLIWQMAYTEFYFSNLFWPDFGKKELRKAFHDYSNRKRRFGRVEEDTTG
jgi:undecaprenyl diphosphate synthase